MNANELIKEVAKEAVLSQDATGKILKALGEVVKKELLAGGKLTLPGIAVLSTGEVASRAGRNPQTGEALTIGAYTKVKFRTVKVLKDKIKYKNY